MSCCSKGSKCGCSKGSKCGCSKGFKCGCGCGDMSHNYVRDMCNNYVRDMCNNYIYDNSNNYIYDICHNNYVYNKKKKDVSYNVTSSYCTTCNKLLTNSISLNNEVCDCSINYLIYTGDISNVEIEFEYSDGPTGPMGPTGPIGISGETGPMGPTGPAGPASSSIEPYEKTYLSICSMKEQYILVDEPIMFEEQTAIMGDCMHIDEKSEIYVWKSGYYLININIYTLSPCQFSIIKNMLYIVKGSTIGGISGSLQNTHTFIINITEDDMISDYSGSPTGKSCILHVVNSSSITRGINLYGSTTTGTPIPQITASFTMISIE